MQIAQNELGGSDLEISLAEYQFDVLQAAADESIERAMSYGGPVDIMDHDVQSAQEATLAMPELGLSVLAGKLRAFGSSEATRQKVHELVDNFEPRELVVEVCQRRIDRAKTAYHLAAIFESVDARLRLDGLELQFEPIDSPDAA